MDIFHSEDTTILFQPTTHQQLESKQKQSITKNSALCLIHRVGYAVLILKYLSDPLTGGDTLAKLQEHGIQMYQLLERFEQL